LAAVVLCLSVPSVLLAQTKISGTMKCEKPDPAYSIEVGDRPGHVMVLQKQTCSYAQSFDINTDKAKDASGVASVDVNSTRATYTGSYVDMMESGDKTFTTIKGATAMKDGKPEGDHGPWAYTGGTGKLKGIKGKGTYKSTINADGTSTIEFEGDYELPQPKAASKK
jgi:uncharacterized protein GlcG (DUF336 family)